MMITLNEEQQQIINTVRRFIEREVKPVASDMEHQRVVTGEESRADRVGPGELVAVV